MFVCVSDTKTPPSEGIRLLHVGKSFGAVRAVVDVSLDLAPGTVVVIEGPNGSGKSTLLGMLGTLIRPTAGRIDYGRLGSSFERVRARIGWLGHDTLCYPDLTGRENIELAARLAGVDPEEAWRRSAERFAIGEFGGRAMRTASRGQRQRVALARAVVHAPDVLLLDEPSTGLDVSAVERVERVIAEEVARGATIAIITHDAKFAASMKHERYRMDRGRLRRAS
jgi:ABC-type multidrug transport system ATPase subunit